MATPGLLKTTVFWNKGYDVIIPVLDVTNKMLLRESIYILDLVMWPEFSNSSISIREVIITSILKGLDQKNRFFYEGSWFKFNNLGLVLGTILEFYNSVAKGLKLKVRKFWVLIPTSVEITGEKLVGRPFCLPPLSWIWLKMLLQKHVLLQSSSEPDIGYKSVSVQESFYRKYALGENGKLQVNDIFINETNDYVFLDKPIFIFKFTSVLFQLTHLSKWIVFKELS